MPVESFAEFYLCFFGKFGKGILNVLDHNFFPVPGNMK